MRRGEEWGGNLRHVEGSVAQLVECSLSMGEVPGSKPGRSRRRSSGGADGVWCMECGVWRLVYARRYGTVSSTFRLPHPYRPELVMLGLLGYVFDRTAHHLPGTMLHNMCAKTAF